MNVGSPTFVAFLLGALLAFHGLNQVPDRFKILAINLVFLASFIRTPLAILPTLGFVALGWLLLHLVEKVRHRIAFYFAIACLLVGFVIIKQYSMVPDALIPDFIYSVVGLSYLLFRVLHLLIDVRQGAITRVPGVLAYFNFLFCFLTFVAGPIQRYEEHCEHFTTADRTLNRLDIRAALSRIIEGFVKVVGISVVANDVIATLPISIVPDQIASLSFISETPNILKILLSNSDNESLVRLSLRFLLRAAAFLVYLYVNFSGYMDIVLGSARLFGFRLPENFDRPLISRNMLEFWSRWHITLSNWFKTYLFQPLLILLAVNFGRRKANAYLAVPAFMITFLVMGLWHGTTSAFVYYGLLLGIGVAGNKLFQLLLQRTIGKKTYGRLAANPLYGATTRGLTITYFGLSLCCLWLDADQLTQLAQLYGVTGIAKLIFVASILTTLVLSTWNLVVRWAVVGGDLVAIASGYLGLIWLAMIWGNLLSINPFIEQLVGFGLNDGPKAVLGGLLLIFAWSVRNHLYSERTEAPPDGIGVLSVRILLLLFASLSHAGMTPDFIYKGF